MVHGWEEEFFDKAMRDAYRDVLLLALDRESARD